MDRLTDLCLRHRWWVVGVWFVLLFAGLASAPGLSKRLDANFSLPGQPAYETNQAIEKAYGNGGNAYPVTVVVRDAGTRLDTPQGQAALTTAFSSVTKIGRPPFRVVYPGTAGAAGSVADPRLLADGGHAALGLVLLPEQNATSTDPTDAIRAHVRSSLATSLPGATVGATGVEGLSQGGGSGGSSILVESLLGGAGALLVLIFVFGSFVALLPLLMAIVSIMTTYALVTALTTFTSVSFIVQFLIALIGLGVAIDYALLVVTRWREEREGGADNLTAIRTSMRTAGHSVVFSGVTVAVGLFSLVFLPVPFLRSVAYGGVLIPLVSILVATTLLPVLLLWWGPTLDRRRIGRGNNGQASRPWKRWAALVVRRRWAGAIVALVALGALGYAATHIAVGEPRVSTLSQSGPAYDGLQQIRQAGFPDGSLTPIDILVESGDGSAVVDATSRLPGVLTSFVSGDRPGSVTVEVIPTADTDQPPGSHLISRVKAAVAPLHARVGGTGAGEQAFAHAVYGSFPIMLTVIIVLTFLLLARAFRSLVLPLKAVILNLISVGATYGVLVLVWQEGHGSSAIWNINATGAITSFVPLMVFAFLFGLSMDYEVFILARMREEHDAGQTTDDAVIEGIGRTGRLVTSAALILFLAFLSLSQAPNTDIKIFATGLGAGILLDATIVRALLVPALVSLFGRWNWALPRWLARPLRVAPSPLEPAATS